MSLSMIACLVIDLGWQLHQTHIGVRNSGTFRLQSRKRPAFLRATEKCGAGLRSIRICVVTLRVIPVATVRAVSTGDRRRNYYAVSLSDITDRLAHGFDK